MTTITLKIYRSTGREKRLVQTRWIAQVSEKTLTGNRALAILRREFPEFGNVTFLQKTEDGWLHMRAAKPLTGCNYHFEWEHICVTVDP